MKQELLNFVQNFSKNQDDNWQDPFFLTRGQMPPPISAQLSWGRGRESPLDFYYNHAQTACACTLTIKNGAGGVKQSTESVREEFYTEAQKVLRDGPSERADFLKWAEKWRDRTPPDIQAVIDEIGSKDVNERAVLQNAIHTYRGSKQIIDIARTAAQDFLPRRQSFGPSDADWYTLAVTITDGIKTTGCCSLIYVYWLDEGGLMWGAERLADRIENGISRTTAPLRGIHITEGSEVAGAISKFTSIWQQGDLAAVDERRRQYKALYGFPLHIATPLGRIDTVDPRNAFPATFHRFLSEAMRFYDELRDRQKDPDPNKLHEELQSLGTVLREGNENLRLRRPPEYRAQLEYIKALLGGRRGVPPATPYQLEWERALGGRPGVTQSLDHWESIVDTVAGLYSWKTSQIRDYRNLAESGELILVMIRIVTATGAPLTPGVLLAFLEMMRMPIQKYVSSFSKVAGVDLGRQPFTGTPHDAMVRVVTPPAVPPLRRIWAHHLPATA